jgi:phosphoheptose isomerase
MSRTSAIATGGTPSQNALAEALRLADEILRNIELNEISLSSIALKCSRLARLLNDFEMQTIFSLEVSGYSLGDNGYMSSDDWQRGTRANRIMRTKNAKGESSPTMSLESIETLEANIITAQREFKSRLRSSGIERQST